MAKAGLLGFPIGHSLSSLIFNKLSRRLGRRVDYRALEVRPAVLPQVVSQLPGRGFCGVNVTRPHKIAVMPLLKGLTKEARATGAVNVIGFSNGRPMGHNTDAAGFLDALRRVGFSVSGRDAAIFGRGGAARAAAYALKRAGARRVSLLGRKPRAVPPSELWVNATPLGWNSTDPSPTADLNINCELAFDMVYGRKTAFLRKAAEDGAATCDGLAMLVFQAVRTWEFWFGSLGARKRRETAEVVLRELEGPVRIG